MPQSATPSPRAPELPASGWCMSVWGGAGCEGPCALFMVPSHQHQGPVPWPASLCSRQQGTFTWGKPRRAAAQLWAVSGDGWKVRGGAGSTCRAHAGWAERRGVNVAGGLAVV